MSDKHTTEHVDEVMGMKQGHGKVPRFLILVYAVLAAWAVFYALTAKGIDDTKTVNAQNPKGSAVSADEGKKLATAQCAACHGANFKGSIGPTLVGVTTAPGKGEAYIEGMMKNGGATMPAVAKLNNWNDTQVKSIVEYMKTLK